MRKAVLKIITVAILIGTAPIVDAGLVSYTGELSVGDGSLTATGLWANPSTSITWEISKNDEELWTYEYQLIVPEKEISHFVIEVSETFGCDDLISYISDYPIQIQDYSSENGNPEMPGNIYGLKFDETSGIVLDIYFCTYRNPVWGDFYSKDGKTNGVFNTVYNTGFLLDDPSIAAHNGSEQGHLLRPDTVPEPATIALLSMGGMLISLKRR